MTDIILYITLIGTAIAAIWDLKTNRIMNAITFPMLISGLILNSVNYGISGAKNSILGFTIVTLILLIPFAIGGIGAGDVKLIAAIGALNGVKFGIYTLLCSSIIGGAIALVLAIYHRQLATTALNTSSSIQSLTASLFRGKLPQSDDISTTGIKFPYGLAIFMGTIVTYLLR